MLSTRIFFCVEPASSLRCRCHKNFLDDCKLIGPLDHPKNAWLINFIPFLIDNFFFVAPLITFFRLFSWTGTAICLWNFFGGCGLGEGGASLESYERNRVGELAIGVISSGNTINFTFSSDLNTFSDVLRRWMHVATICWTIFLEQFNCLCCPCSFVGR